MRIKEKLIDKYYIEDESILERIMQIVELEQSIERAIKSQETSKAPTV